MKKYKKLIASTISTIFILAVIFLGYRNYNVILDLTYPFQKAVDTSLSLISDLKNVIVNNYEILSENKVLKQENLKLKLQLQNLKYLEFENAKLKQLLNYSASFNIKNPKLAKVVSFPISEWEKYVIIDAGKANNVSIGDLVVGDGYLVGKITKIGSFSSYVTLVNDPDFKITARMQKTREFVFLKGNGNNVILEYVKKEQDIRVGDIVETDNPKGIPIGKVIKVEDYPTEFFKRVEVKPFLRPLTLEYVLIIKESK